MKRSILLLFCIIISHTLSAQFKKASLRKHPVLHSVPIGEEQLRGYSLSSNYYPLEGNIENPSSSVFIARKPTSEQLINSAQGLFSHFFVVSDQSGVLFMIMLNQKIEEERSRFYFIVMNMDDQQWKEYPCKAEGEITEFRAKELAEGIFNQKSQLSGRKNDQKLIYQEKELKVQPYLALKNDLIRLIEVQLLKR